MIKQHFFLLSAVLLGLGFATEGAARKIEIWEYDRLFDESDVVVIATAVVNEDAPDRMTASPWRVDFQGVNTTFRLRHALKGKSGQDFTVLHFTAGENVGLQDGPLQISFRTRGTNLRLDAGGEKMNVMTARPEYLLFLKARDDGRYEPVSGRIDPILSVRELHQSTDWIGQLSRVNSTLEPVR